MALLQGEDTHLDLLEQLGTPNPASVMSRPAWALADIEKEEEGHGSPSSSCENGQLLAQGLCGWSDSPRGLSLWSLTLSRAPGTTWES